VTDSSCRPEGSRLEVGPLTAPFHAAGKHDPAGRELVSPWGRVAALDVRGALSLTPKRNGSSGGRSVPKRHDSVGGTGQMTPAVVAGFLQPA
jgi:hypothetical protein